MALNPFCDETLHLLLNFMDLEDQLKWTCDQVSLNFENKHQDYCIDCKIQFCNYFHGAYNRPVMNCVNERTQIHPKKSHGSSLKSPTHMRTCQKKCSWNVFVLAPWRNLKNSPQSVYLSLSFCWCLLRFHRHGHRRIRWNHKKFIYSAFIFLLLKWKICMPHFQFCSYCHHWVL